MTMQSRARVTLWSVTTVCRRDYLKAFVEIRRLRNEVRQYAPMNVELQIKAWEASDTPVRHLSLVTHGEQSENAVVMGRVARTLENLKRHAERAAGG